MRWFFRFEIQKFLGNCAIQIKSSWFRRFWYFNDDLDYSWLRIIDKLWFRWNCR